MPKLTKGSPRAKAMKKDVEKVKTAVKNTVTKAKNYFAKKK